MSTVDQIGQNNSGVGTPSSLAITTTEDISLGDTTVLSITIAASANIVSSITDAGSTWVKAVSSGNANTSDCEIWYCASHAVLGSGSTITVNFGGAVHCALTLYRLVNASAYLKDSGAATSNSGSPSASTSGSVNGNVLVFGCASDANSLTAPGGIWTSDYLSNTAGQCYNHCHGAMTSAGTATFNPTAASTSWGAAIAAFVPPNAVGFFVA